MKCAICGNEIGWYGYNPCPILSREERVCKECRSRHVLPARMGAQQEITTYDGRVLTVQDGIKPELK